MSWGDPVDHLIRFSNVCRNCVNFVDIRADGAIVASPYLPLILGNIRNHRFSEYWEAGLPRLWRNPQINRMAQRVASSKDFAKQNLFSGKDYEIDIIKDINL